MKLGMEILVTCNQLQYRFTERSITDGSNQHDCSNIGNQHDCRTEGVRGLGLTSSSEEEEDSGSSSWSMKVGAEAAETTGWCGGDGGGTETALPAMRASSLASLDEDGLEFDERCCTMSSPAADIAAACSQTGSGRAPEASRRSNRRRTSRSAAPPHRGCASTERGRPRRARGSICRGRARDGSR